MKPIRVPLRRSELAERWRDLAGELELPFNAADLAIGSPADPAHLCYPVDRCATALDRAVARARKRLPRYCFDPDTLTLTADPRGGRDNLRALVDELRSAAEARHRSMAAAELRSEAASDRLPAGRIAARWGVSRTTLYRWLGEVRTVAFSSPNGTDGAPGRAEDQGEVVADRYPAIPSKQEHPAA